MQTSDNPGVSVSTDENHPAAKIIADLYRDAEAKGRAAGLPAPVLVASIVATGLAALRASGAPDHVLLSLLSIGIEASDTFKEAVKKDAAEADKAAGVTVPGLVGRA